MENHYDRSAVSEITSLSRHTIARYIKQGKFPKPVKKISGQGGKQLWSESQLEKWFAEDEGKAAA